MILYRRIICAGILAGVSSMAAGQQASEKGAEAAVEEKESASVFAAGQDNVAAAYKQIDIINIDEAVIEKGRLALLKGNVKIAFIPRDPVDPPDPTDAPAPPDPPVTLQADGARFIYADDVDTMPAKVETEGRVIVVQGENRFATDHATWYRDEAKVLCEGNVEISYGQNKMYAESIEHYLVEERTVVVGNVRGTMVPETTEETTEPVQERTP